jgi:hypothetical protein
MTLGALAAWRAVNRQEDANMPSHDIPQLEKHIKSLHEAVNDLAQEDDFIEMLKIIHFPGYTTPAEYRLVAGLIAEMTAQVRALTNLRGTVLAASQMMVAGERVGAESR